MPTKKLKNSSSDISDIGHILNQITNKITLLERKNKNRNEVIKSYKQFKKIMGQTLHDLQTPLTSLYAISNSQDKFTEQKRIAFKSSVINALDIINVALNSYKPSGHTLSENNKRQPIMVSTVLADIINEQKCKCKNLPIEFSYNLSKLNGFLFIKAAPSDFKRAISNIINNAIDSLHENSGKIELKVKSNDEWVYISILDDGKGIPQDILEKIEKGVTTTSGKGDSGHGIGLSQVRDMLQDCYGEIEIFSSIHKISHGTTIELKFPKISPPNWVIDEVSINPDDTIVILDDNKQIHNICANKFSHIIEKIPSIKIKYFFDGNDVINYVTTMSVEEKTKVCLLSSHELINQNLNGVEIIEKCGIKRSILLSNSSPSLELRKKALPAKIKILPKKLIGITSSKIIKSKSKTTDMAKVHMVFIDDEKLVTDTIIAEYYSHLLIDQYSNPFKFLDSIAIYPSDTKFIIDNYYYAEDSSTYEIDGIEIAKQLHDKGYTRLFLLSGEKFAVPDYLTLILKSDKEKIKNLDKL